MSKHVFTSTLILWVVLAHVGYAQITKQPQPTKESPLYIDGFDYPDFDGFSNYALFKVNFPLTESTEFSIGGRHYRTFFADRFIVPFQMKQYLDNKTYILGGYQWEWDLLNDGFGYPNPIPRQDYFYGVGHDVRPNIMIEATIVQPVGTPKFHDIGLEGARTRLKFATKLKF
ncbi:hypothetical protein J0X14_16905 [Muricauda sp. CAU 1633]|uniref:hypothetical protein n=1 Tax=Allomuricauda sp. CAU 1633 TaxID=2816036 RepID=UPI001A8E12D1|nr:hypothetical protein [Muricauda sp. CAU 1633]MBO0323991.1 hypothetical protein [Muricauda sp. CAU 1633]